MVELATVNRPVAGSSPASSAIVCKGSIYLGSGCRRCVKCQQELADYADVFETPYPADEPVEPIQLDLPFEGTDH